MTGPKDPLPKRKRSETVPDPMLTKTLAERMKREIALEKASEETTKDEGEDAPVVVVLGPDGVPQIADEPERAPETVRFDLDHEVKTKPPPQTKPPAKKP